MEYFAGLDISMDETHVCVLDCEGVIVHERKTTSTAQAIAGELAKAPSCRRIVFETGRMAPILFHGLSQLGLQLKLKDWAFAIAKRSTMRKAKVALARRLAIIMHAMLRDGTEFAST